MQAALRFWAGSLFTASHAPNQTAYYGAPSRLPTDMEPQYFAYPAYLVVLMSPFARLPWTAACLALSSSLRPCSSSASGLACARSTFPFPAARWLSPHFFRCAVGRSCGDCACSNPRFYCRRAVPRMLLPESQSRRCRRNSAGALDSQAADGAPAASFSPAVGLRSAVVEPHRILRGHPRAPAALGGAMVPGWFGHWRASVRGYGPHTELPLQTIAGPLPGLILTAALLGWCSWFLWNLRRSPSRLAAVSRCHRARAGDRRLLHAHQAGRHLRPDPDRARCLLLIFSKTEDY